MDISDLAPLIPFGPPTVIFVYLMKVLITENKRREEREATVAKEHSEDIARREADHEVHEKQWRERYEYLEKRHRELTKQYEDMLAAQRLERGY